MTYSSAKPGIETSHSESALSRLYHRKDAMILAALFLSSISLHIVTAARTVTFSDSGDFLMAISTVGNCHGPGYPLYLMVAKVFSWLVPFGSLAFRVSLLSGVFASLAGCLIYWAIYRMTRSRIGGVVAALAFLFSYTFWYQTAIPETYGLNVFFFALLVVLILRWERLLGAGRKHSADNALAIFAFVFGLAMTNHFSAIFLLPAFAFFAFDTNRREVFSLKNLLRMGAFFILGLLPYVYEPTAAFRGPAYNYGDPSTLTRWFQHVTLLYQRGGLFGYPLRFWPGRFWRYFVTLTTEFPYFFWLAALGLLVSFFKKSKKYALFLLLLFLATALAVMSYDQLESVLRAHFYYPSYFVVALWIGFGAAWLSGLVKRWSAGKDKILRAVAVTLVAVILVALVCVSIPVHYGKVDKSNYAYARDMAVKMLKRAQPDGLILVDSDNTIFPLKYMQSVEGIGPGVRVINPKSLGVPGWTATDLDRSVPPPSADISSTEDLYARIVKTNYGKIPVFTTGLTFDFFGWNQQWQGFLTRIYPPGVTQQAADPVSVGKGNTPLADIDSDAREAIALSDILKAYYAINGGNTKEAERLYGDVTRFAAAGLYVPTLYGCETIVNVFDVWGQVTNQRGDFKKTVRELPKAFVFNPDFVSLPLAYAYSRTGNNVAAINAFSDYLIVHPGYAAAYLEMGELELLMSNYKAAVSSLRTAVSINPEEPQSHYDLGVALLRLNDRNAAVSQLKAAIEKGPQTKWADLARGVLSSIKEPVQ